MKLRALGLQYLHRSLSTPINARPSFNLSCSASWAYRNQTTRRQAHRGYASVSAADLQFGQPVHETHPHILKAGEITPGISAQEYHERRSKLAAKLPPNAIAILAASDVKYRSGVVFYEFHQERNFFYLTGFNEPEAVAVIQNTGASGDYVFHLFVRQKNRKAELWDGPRSGPQAAVDVFNADEAGDISQLSTLLTPIVAQASEVYTDIPITKSTYMNFFVRNDVAQSPFDKMLQGSKVKPLGPLLIELRLFKSEAEIKMMRSAGRASGRAITNAMRRKWTREKDLCDFLEYDFKSQGCDTSAYVPVVGGGRNGLCIHYVRNDDILKNGDMVVVDAGGEIGGYVTDISRTWPINGKFSDAQRDLYEMVLKVQRSSISLCRDAANISLDKINQITEHSLGEGLKQLGFDMTGNAMDILFPHHVGHHIGLDVHDSSGAYRSANLKVGQCIAVEPGIYVPDDDRWPKHFRGMGVRIEDSVCIQDDTALVLSTEAVKEIADIEALRD